MQRPGLAETDKLNGRETLNRVCFLPHLVLSLQYKPHSQSEKKPESLAEPGKKKEQWQKETRVTLFGTWQGSLLGRWRHPASLTRYRTLDQACHEALADLWGEIHGKHWLLQLRRSWQTHLVRSSRGGSSLGSAAAAPCDLLPTSAVPTFEF